MQQVIWLNSMLCIHGKPFIFQKAYEAHIVHIADIHNGIRFLSYKEICDNFGNCMTWLEYRQLVSVVSKHWAAQLKVAEYGDTIPYKYAVVNENFKLARIVYDKFIQHEKLLQKYYDSWQQPLQVSFTFKKYIKAFKSITNITIATKYRDFQYRFLLRKTFTNIQLSKWRLVDSQLCTFCKNEDETMIHLFFVCPKVQQLWTDLIVYGQDNGLDSECDFSISNRILNCVHVNSRSVVNLLILVLKQFIYRCKCLDKLPTSQD